MTFWIEGGGEISYTQLIEDLNSECSSSELAGYEYFYTLLKGLISGEEIPSIQALTSYLIREKSALNFDIRTSGTTSVPKCISVNVSNCIRHVKRSKEGNKRVWGMGYPCGSFASTQVFFQALMNAETIVYLFGIEFNSLNSVFAKERLTNLSCTPTFLSMLLMNMGKKYSSVMKITTGGEKMKSSLIQSIKATFPCAEYVNIYASTETGSLLYSTTENFSIPEKYSGTIKIENGTLRVHKSLLNNFHVLEGDWYDTEDVVEFVDGGSFKFVTRVNGYINTGGFRVAPLMIEDAIMGVKGVQDVHVYGKSNSVLGSIVCADVIGEGVSALNIKRVLSNRLIEKHMIPRIIRIVDNFEHVSNGKKRIVV
jgi:acyl-coenzyme A synthetase/AMP-(fatty) acid ligase